MMVVLGEVLGQLEPGELVLGRDPPHDPGTLEIDQMAVGRTPRNLRKPGRDIRDAHRVADRGEHVDDGPPPGRVAKIDPTEPDLDELMQIVVGGERRRRPLSSRCHRSLLFAASHRSLRPHTARGSASVSASVSLVMRLSLTLTYRREVHTVGRKRSGAGRSVLARLRGCRRVSPPSEPDARPQLRGAARRPA